MHKAANEISAVAITATLSVVLQGRTDLVVGDRGLRQSGANDQVGVAVAVHVGAK